MVAKDWLVLVSLFIAGIVLTANLVAGLLYVMLVTW